MDSDDDRIERALRSLPKQTASPDFTERVLREARARRRPARWPVVLLAAALPAMGGSRRRPKW